MPEHQHLLGKGVVITEVEELVPKVSNKEHYFLHSCNLQLYLSLAMHLKKIQRALRFKQSAWMEPNIRMSIELRRKATSDFEKSLYKLMNNSVFKRPRRTSASK